MNKTLWEHQSAASLIGSFFFSLKDLLNCYCKYIELFLWYFSIISLSFSSFIHKYLLIVYLMQAKGQRSFQPAWGWVMKYKKLKSNIAVKFSVTFSNFMIRLKLYKVNILEKIIQYESTAQDLWRKARTRWALWISSSQLWGLSTADVTINCAACHSNVYP